MLRRTVSRRAERLFTVGGAALSGFMCTEVREIPELNMVGYHLEHEKTKASYFHFQTPDQNNAFCIGFRTPAPNNRGTTHVLEHTVLCGSEKYPVRDPFFLMIRRTLSNFMNALTGADYTLYPFATTNATDYRNLLSVYLDATLRPLLRAEDFFQEGHRLELLKDEVTGEETDNVRHNGVVYNEMKGVVSDPSRFFSQKLQEKTLPGTHYEYVSGGNPPQILDMTHEELVAFHKHHYHPSNSVTMTYGSLHPKAAMAQLDEYFSTCDAATTVEVPRLKKYHNGELVLETTGPLDLFGNPTAQKRVAVATAIPQALDTADNLVKMSVLSELLTSGPSSPLYKSLIESKIGTKYAPGTGYAYYLSTPMLGFGLEGIDEARKGAGAEVEKIIDDTLATVAKEGFDQRRVEAVVFQEMLQQKHRDANYGIGIVTGLAAMALVKPHQNILHFINTVPTLREIAKDHKKELLPLLSAAFIENKHKVRLTVSPDAKFIEKANAPIEVSEAKLTAEMTKEEKAELSKKTAAWLERVRAPTDGSCLPSLRVTDIPSKGFEQPSPIPVGRRLFHIPYETNGLVYIHSFIPLSKAIADALLGTAIVPAADATTGNSAILKSALLHSFCGRTGAGGLDYKELSIAFDQCMSGFSLSPIMDNTQVNSNEFACGAMFSFYTVKDKVKEAMELIRKVLAEPTTKSDAITDRIDVLTTSRASSLARAVQHQGNTYAMLRAASKTALPMFLKELRGGISQVSFSTQLLSMTTDAKKAYIADTVSEYETFTSDLQHRMGNALIYFTCEQHDAADVVEIMKSFQSAFGQSVQTAEDWLVFPSDKSLIETLSEKIPLQLDTSFAATVLPHELPFVSDDMQKLRVACKLLSNEFLHRKIREEGGAYGAGCTGNILGTARGIGFSSYRDPTPDKSLAAFAESAAWLCDAANITEERLEQAKLTLFATIDAPISPDVFGYESLLNKLTPELNQHVRNNILSVTKEDVFSVAKYFDFNSKKSSTVAITPNGSAVSDNGEMEGEEGGES